MATQTRSWRPNNRQIVGTTLIALLAIAGGWVMAASFSITNGATETGAGAYHGTALLTFWSETAAGVGGQPGALPTALSTTIGTPTVLAGAAANYAVNTPTAGDIVHYWKFAETTAAPINTEVEMQFSVSTGAVPTVTQVTVFIETQASAPGATITYTLYYDLGAASSGTITLNSVTEVSLQCASVGNCP
jgi:hypothetical protein